MDQRKSWINNFLKEISEKPQKISKQFDELIYGKLIKTYSIKQLFLQSSTLFLSESNIEILVVVTNNQEIHYDIRDCRFVTNHYRYQMQYGLAENLYIILQNIEHQTILLFPHKEDKNQFLNLLKYLNKSLKNSPLETDSVILTSFIATDINQNMSLSQTEIQNLLKRLKIEKNDYLESIIDWVKQQTNLLEGEINFKQFQKIYKLFACRLELKPIYEKYTKIKIKSFHQYLLKIMTRQQFKSFLSNQQKQTELESQKIIRSIFQSSEKISFYEFSQYLVSNQNLATIQDVIDEVNMNKPLNNYYCHSSHNTYLTGNQLTSSSKTQRYLQDLENGIRCVQIDIHDGEKGPIVKHGYTMTSSITFQNVINALAKYSYRQENHTPIIISLQNHCGLANQLKMAQIMKDKFGTRLFTIRNWNELNRLPTLRQLLGKIIIKGSGNYLQYTSIFFSRSEVNLQNSQAIEIEEENREDQEDCINQIVHKQVEKISTYPRQFIEKIIKFKHFKESQINKKKQFLKNKTNILSSLKNMGNFNQKIKPINKIHLKLLEITSMLGKGSIKRANHWESISISENSILKHFKENNGQLIKQYTLKGWIRSYPSGSRVDSSNYNPLPSLEMGVQIIALNTQNVDFYSLLMKQFFKKTKSNCIGYRQKCYEIEKSKPKQLKIIPVSCYKITQNRYSQQTPQIEILMSFIGHSIDMLQNNDFTQHKPYTQTIRNNAYNPVFQNGKLMNLRISRIDLAFVKLEIKDCGIAILPLERIKKGIRGVKLIDENNEQKEAKILLLIS